MNLIFIHGPPAVGKLSVSKELSKLTGYKIFHNHLSMDLVNSVFERDTTISYELIKKIRILIIETAARKNIPGIIFTFSDVSGDNFKFAKNVSDVVKKNNGKIFFVRLFCDKKYLFKRVKGKSRKSFGKFTKPSLVKKVLKNWNFERIVPFSKTLEIDNTKLSPKKVALKIKEFYNL